MGSAIVATVVAASATVLGLAGAALEEAPFHVYDATWRAEVKSERERAASVRQPTRRGVAPLDENVTTRYRKLFRPQLLGAGDVALIASVARGSTRPPEIEPILAARRDELAALRDAVRCTRCDWEIPWETAAQAPLPDLIAARSLCSLLAIEARGLAPREAVAASLDVLRVGADLATGGTFILEAIGCAIEHVGLRTLGEAISRAKPGELDLGDLALELDRIVAARGGPGLAVHGERLTVRSFETLADLEQAHRGLSNKQKRALLRAGVLELDVRHREVESALALADHAARDRALDAVQARVDASKNEVVAIGMPNVRNLVAMDEELQAAERVVATALRLERARAADGTYPRTIELPVGASVRYERSEDGKGWTLSSKRLTLKRG